EDRPATRHPVELHHALRDVERVVVGQRDDAGGELDAVRALGSRGEKHLRRADHLPAARMVLAAPEFVITELVEMLDQVEVAAELQQRVLADRVVRREKRAEFEAGHARDLLIALAASTAAAAFVARLNPQSQSRRKPGPTRQ